VAAQSMGIMSRPVEVFLQCIEDPIYIGRVRTLACTVMFFGTC